jgi:hypothetical protein
LWFKASPGKRLQYPKSTNKAGVEVYAYNFRTQAEATGRTVVPGWLPGEKLKTLFEK